MATTLTSVPRVPAEIDFSQRVDPALLPELMDGPCSYEDFRDCVRDIAATSRLTRAYGPTRSFVEQVAVGRSEGAPLHVLDVGSGGGDMLRHVADWAQRRHVAVRLTGIDLNAHATFAATEFSGADPRYARIEWLTGDVFREPATQDPDVVLSSLVTHHMRDDEIVGFLRWMEEHARVGWFISDLVRSPRSYSLFGTLSRVMRWHRFVRHDGLVSIRRGFREPDWERLLRAAGVPVGAVQMRRAALGRLCLTRMR